MANEFQGFSQQTQDFLWNLRFHNERPWFLENKTLFQSHVESPLHQLAHQTHKAFDAQHPTLNLNLRISRVYRDARRLHGRGPYKEHLWFVLLPATDKEEGVWMHPAFYFEISPECCMAGLGWYDATPLTMAKLRARIERDPKPLEKLTRALKKDGEFHFAGETYKRPKRDEKDLLAPWCNHKTIALEQRFLWDDAFLPSFADTLLARFSFLVPYYKYLDSLGGDPDPRLPQG